MQLSLEVSVWYRVFQKSLCNGSGLMLGPTLSDLSDLLKFYGNVSEK